LRIQCSPFPLVFFWATDSRWFFSTWLAGKFPMKFDDLLTVSPFHPVFLRQHLSNMSFQKPQYPIKVPLFNYYIMHIPSYSMSMEWSIINHAQWIFHGIFHAYYSMNIPSRFHENIPMVSFKPWEEYGLAHSAGFSNADLAELARPGSQSRRWIWRFLHGAPFNDGFQYSNEWQQDFYLVQWRVVLGRTVPGTPVYWKHHD
jgi:hypothetical protein